MDTTTQLWWVDEIEKRTNNRVTFQRYLGGALASVPEHFGLVRDGAIDIGVTQYGAHPAENPTWEMERNFIDGPTDVRIVQDAWVKMYDKFDVIRNLGMNNNQKLVFSQVIGPYHIISFEPMTTLADFKGKIIGAWGAYMPKYFEPVGASAVTTPGTERYINLKQKLIDASCYTSPDTASYKHYEVAKHYTKIGLPAPLPYTTSINMDTWNSLDKELQDLFMKVGREAAYVQIDSLEKGISESEELLKSKGVTFHELSAAEFAEWTALCEYIPWEWIEANSPKFPANDMLQSWVDFCKEGGWTFAKDWQFTQ